MIRSLLIALCLVLPVLSQTPKASIRATPKHPAQPATQDTEPPPDAKTLEGLIAVLKDGYAYHSCLNSDLTNGPIPSPDPKIGGVHPAQAELYGGVELRITNVVAEPYTGADGGYRLYLQFVDAKSSTIYHGQVWVGPINNGVSLSTLRHSVIEGMSFSTSEYLRGIQTPRQGMRKKDLECHFVEPEAVNDYGGGEEQWVFYGGNLLVYLSDGRVSNVQRFSH
ncbi:MAG TPA: hypothetical protein VK638_37005 [Edaphobacter sp.]|nr:hypothetical protein [Edaphobacter sp.]